MGQWHPAGSASERAHLQDVGELAYMGGKQQQSWEWICNHPARFAELTADRFCYYWMPPDHMWPPSASTAPTPCSGLWSGRTGIAGLSRLSSLVIGGVGLSGAGRQAVACLHDYHVEMRDRYPTFALSVLLTFQLAAVGVRAGRDLVPLPPLDGKDKTLLNGSRPFAHFLGREEGGVRGNRNCLTLTGSLLPRFRARR